MRFTTDVSVREPEAPVLRVITTACVPEAMSDLAGSYPEAIQPQGPFSALPEPIDLDEWTPSWYDPTERTSPFIVSDTDV